MANFFTSLPKPWRITIWIAGLFLAGFILGDFVLMPIVARRGAVVDVPALRGMTYDQAVQVLAQKGLEIMAVGWQSDPGLQDSMIVSQEPEPRMMVKKGRRIKVILCRSAEKLPVPYLVGLSAVRAINLLDRTGLTVSAIDSVASDSVAPGCVVSCQPPPGTKLEKGAAVALTLSKGPTEGKLLMPDIVGKKLVEVQGQLVAQGLVIGEIKYSDDSVAEPGIIVNQTPQPGFVVKRGDTVNVAVGTK